MLSEYDLRAMSILIFFIFLIGSGLGFMIYKGITMDIREKTNFNKEVHHTVIAVGTIQHLDLSTIKAAYGINYNSLSIVNESSEDISLFLDNKQVKFLKANGGYWDFTHEKKIVFMLVAIKNEGLVNPIAIDEIKVYVGRTGT